MGLQGLYGSKKDCSLKYVRVFFHTDTYADFTQVNSIIQRIPGTLLVIGPPGLLEDLVHALAFLPLRPIATGDPRRSWDPVGSGVTVSARGACRTLQAASKLGREEKKKKKKTEKMGVDLKKHLKVV